MRVVACSVRGPAHAREGIRCQDAWLAIPDPSGCFAVVCDGMGSRPHAREGARAATIAARDAWRVWRRSPAGSVEDMIRVLEATWRLRLDSITPDAAATTCLFYAEDNRGRAALAQLGDGLIARRSRDGAVSVHPSRAHSFNVTCALGTPHSLTDWSLALAPSLAPLEAVLLATDGVSEDLDQARLGDFVAWVIEEIGSRPRPAQALASELRRWPVPRHQDDKTLSVLWKPCNPSSK